MDTIQINRLMRKYEWNEQKFCGVLPIDKLPLKKVKRPCSFIITTDDSSLPGRHWFALYLPRTGPIEYFDSFGIKPLNKEVYEFIKINGGKWKYNNIQIQDFKSKSCGKICILYLSYCNRGLTLKDFNNLFTKYTLYNERIVRSLFNKTFIK